MKAQNEIRGLIQSTIINAALYSGAARRSAVRFVGGNRVSTRATKDNTLFQVRAAAAIARCTALAEVLVDTDLRDSYGCTIPAHEQISRELGLAILTEEIEAWDAESSMWVSAALRHFPEIARELYIKTEQKRIAREAAAK
jgi:hypothetical protein